ncbi:hypothetical protein [Limosilactobacillus reuteri]|uniref:hypothetical protein n=1 Tax=Limosilactobacillus reuteri TaxID=1598 RepID=UPI002B05EBE0|nr:hypothetical protein [Limosilactobacillus reuteri]
MRCDDVKTKAEIMDKYGLKTTAMSNLVAECECSQFHEAIIRITGHVYWVHENIWVEFLEHKASIYHQHKFGRLRRGVS